MPLQSIASYAKQLKPILAPDTFAPARSRLLWLPVHIAVVALVTTALARGWVSFWLAPVASLLIGCSFAGMAFVAHETLHGAIVRGKRLRHVIGGIAFSPFMISPRLWVAWHNRVHHGNANQPHLDPDSNPSIEQYRESSTVRFVTDHLTPGRESATGIIGILVGLTGQSGQVLIKAASRGYMSPREHRLACYEAAAAAAVWLTTLVLVGPVVFLFTFILPLIVANSIVMAFIFTNHGLSPTTTINDPLANSLSVTTPRLVEWLTLGFGFHVEHHLFPAMSTRQAPALREQLRTLWPDRYQSMSLVRALRTLHATGRVYQDATTLTDPNTGLEWSTLGSAPLAPSLLSSLAPSLASGVAAPVERAAIEAQAPVVAHANRSMIASGVVPSR